MSAIAPTAVLAVDAQELEFAYQPHRALDGLSLTIEAGEIFALLGPNGSGKTTFFKLLTTLLPMQAGKLSVFGADLASQASSVRRSIGVVFQNPSVDRKLTVEENLRCQAAIFGLPHCVPGLQRSEKSTYVSQRIAAVANELGFADRLRWKVEKLSGGMQRRVDIAKSMLHAPRLLILDEPSTGLDPAARLDLWHSLVRLRDQHGVTILLTTHLLEEAEKAQRIGILHRGRMVAVGPPTELRRAIGQRVLVVDTDQPQTILNWLERQGLRGNLETAAASSESRSGESTAPGATAPGSTASASTASASTASASTALASTGSAPIVRVRVTGEAIGEYLSPLVAQCGQAIHSISLSEPSLEDVFVAKTGHRFWDSGAS